jgi:outer membrane biosynthesis protein TonB
MKQWKFEPYIHDGHPVQVGYKMPYDFATADRVFDNPMPAGNTDLITGTTSPSTSGTTILSSGPNSISSGELQKFLVHQVAPVYPDMARQRMVQGTVVLKAVIGTDGGIKGLKVISGRKELYEAMGAVRNGVISHTTLDGNPVEVEGTINVSYKLKN